MLQQVASIITASEKLGANALSNFILVFRTRDPKYEI